MLTKTLPVQIKSTGPTGEFEAIVATYDVDSVGDKIMPGAFAKTLADHKASGQPIPVYWSHQHEDPFANIGVATELAERDGEGLWVKGQLDMDNPKAAYAHKLLATRRVDNFSFAYDVEDAAPNEADEAVTDLKQIKLYEVGPTLIGANQGTRALAVKADAAARTKQQPGDDPRAALAVLLGVFEAIDSIVDEAQEDLAEYLGLQPPDPDEEDAEMEPEPGEPSPAMAAARRVLIKMGRVISAKNEAELQGAHDAIGRVLAQLRTDDQGKSAPPAVKAIPAPDEATGQELRADPADPLFVHLHALELELRSTA